MTTGIIFFTVGVPYKQRWQKIALRREEQVRAAG